MSDVLIRTIEDMEKLYYDESSAAFLSVNDMQGTFINKTDAPVTSSTTGVYNAVYGAQAWVQLNMEANTFGVLPKVPHTRSGWRAISARSDTLPYGGVGETAALPDTTKPTFAEISTKPKLSAVTFEASEIQEFLAGSGGDDAIGGLSDLRAYMAMEHKEDLNAQLNTQNGTTASNNFESVDRVVGSYAELTNCKENDESTAYTAGDLDIYGLDRDGGATYADAYVNYNATSGAVRSLTNTLMQTLLSNTLKNGANPEGQIIQTGYDTWGAINELYDSQVRYNIIGEAEVAPSVNGVKGPKGAEVALRVSTWGKIPVILSKDTVVDTGGISRINLLDISNPEGFDLPRLCIRVAKPTQYFEAGINQGTPFATNTFSSKGMYRTMGELICTFAKVQGKLRDLKS